ncbi:MAG TPA: hypothetical protein VGN99_05910 [Steroidobacteraceae bacterium]|nr:hypothetical protein [Steroidobacteraceae bacterium]
MNLGSDDGDLPGGGGGGKPPDGASVDPPSSSLKEADQASGDLLKLTQGKPLTSGDGDEEPAPDAPLAKSFTSHDFTYDKTGLPHYPDAIKAIVSSITYEVPNRTDTYRTGAGIVTTSPFATVVDWYQKNLPGGWQSTTVGDFAQLGANAQQLSPENILKMLGAGAAGGSAPGSLTPAPATASADRIRISIFKPPAGSKNEPGIMIVQKGDHPVEALLAAHVKP